MESKLIQIILLLVFIAVMVVLYLAFKDSILANLKYLFKFF